MYPCSEQGSWSRPRAAQPRGGDGVVAVEVDVIGGEPERHAGGRAAVAGLAVGPIRALARLERLVDFAEPPRRPAQPLPRRAGRVALERAAEALPRVLPRAAVERLAAGRDRVLAR